MKCEKGRLGDVPYAVSFFRCDKPPHPQPLSRVGARGAEISRER
jgi:hypothetical protein